MNVHQSSTIPAPEATESDADRAETFTLTSAELRELQPSQMDDLFDALLLASESLNGVLCRPRCMTEDKNGFPIYHFGAEIIEALLEYIDRCRAMVVDAAEKSEPKTVKELERKAWIALQDEIRFGEDLTAFTALAAQLTADLKRKSWELEVRS